MAQDKFERFGNYILLEKLAAGGMAEIYLSKKLAAEGVQKFVAVKRILSQHSTSEEFIRMFKDEAKIAVNLSHSNVVSIYDFGTENNQLYLVMDYVEGKNLRQILNRLKQNNKRFSISHIVFITKLISGGLEHAHRLIDATTGHPLNIIHRDMSPQNVMVSFEGEVKIIDFGIAKSTTQEESTRVGTLKGKFGYMSPEQVDGMEVDARTDIFAVGIMIWEMLSEQRLFLTNNEMTTLRKIRDCKIPSLREIDPNIPVELEKIVNKALARNKTQRYQTSAELQRDLQSFLNRYNPDFSNHDFAEFIKEIYAEEIVEARKRQVAYSKVDLPHISESRQDNFTQSMTFSKNTADKVNFGELSIRKGTIPDLPDQSPSNLQMNPNARGDYSSSIKPSGNTALHRGMNPENRMNYTNSSIRVPPRPQSSSSPLFGFFIVLLAGSVGAFALLNETQPKLVARQCQSLRKIGVPINCYEGPQTARLVSKGPKMKISSEPTGAYIYLNSKALNVVTPAEIDVTPNQPFTISLAMNGHRNETQSFTSIPASATAYFKLTSIPSGTMILRVIGEAYLNGQRVQNGQKMIIEANKEFVFKAVNPLTGKSREIKASIGLNETKEVLISAP